MDNTSDMEANLHNIQRGATTFRVIGTLCLVLGIGGYALHVLGAILEMYDGARLVESGLLTISGSVINHCLVGWLAHRVSDTFRAVSALIIEMREIV